MNITIFKVMWRHLKRFNGREQLQRVLADRHTNARKDAEEAFKCFLKNRRSLRLLHVNGLRRSELNLAAVVCFLKWYSSLNVRDVAFSQVYMFDYRLDDVAREFLHILRSDYGRHVPGRFQGCSQCLDAVKTLR